MFRNDQWYCLAKFGSKPNAVAPVVTLRCDYCMLARVSWRCVRNSCSRSVRLRANRVKTYFGSCVESRWRDSPLILWRTSTDKDHGPQYSSSHVPPSTSHKPARYRRLHLRMTTWRLTTAQALNFHTINDKVIRRRWWVWRPSTTRAVIIISGTQLFVGHPSKVFYQTGKWQGLPCDKQQRT